MKIILGSRIHHYVKKLGIFIDYSSLSYGAGKL